MTDKEQKRWDRWTYVRDHGWHGVASFVSRQYDHLDHPHLRSRRRRDVQRRYREEHES